MTLACVRRFRDGSRRGGQDTRDGRRRIVDPPACARGLVAAGYSCWSKLDERARERRRRGLCDRGAQTLAEELRLGLRHRGRRRRGSGAGDAEPATEPTARPDAPPARPAARDAQALRAPLRDRWCSTSRGRGAERRAGERPRDGAGRGRRGASRQHPPGRRDLPARGGRASACSRRTRTRSGACRWPSGCSRMLDQLEARGRAASIGISAGVVACPDHGADAEPPAEGRRGDVAGPRGRPAGRRRPLRALQDR